MNQESDLRVSDDNKASAPKREDALGSALRLVEKVYTTGYVPSTLDRVTTRALEEGIVSDEQVASVGRDISGSAQVGWRQVACAFSDAAADLQQLAAETYGYRKILVCEVGTLVYNNLLTRILSPLHWQLLFDEAIIPVLEFGVSPESQERLTLGASDPSARSVRDVMQKLPFSPINVVFVPGSQVSELQELLLSNLDAIRVPILSGNRTIIREFIDTEDGLVPNEIIRRAA